jgi:hypothetical protein
MILLNIELYNFFYLLVLDNRPLLLFLLRIVRQLLDTLLRFNNKLVYLPKIHLRIIAIL